MIHSLLLHSRPPRQARAVAVAVRRHAGDQVELAERSTQLHVARRHEALGDGRRELLFRHDPSHDVRGRRIATLAAGSLAAGDHVVQWNGRDDRGREASAGVYFVRLQADREVATKKVLKID